MDDRDESPHKQSHNDTTTEFANKQKELQTTVNTEAARSAIQINANEAESIIGTWETTPDSEGEDSDSMVQLPSPHPNERLVPNSKDQSSDKHDQDNCTSPQDVPRPDILWALTVSDKDKPDQSFFKDKPWEGVNNGLPGSDPEDDDEKKAVVVYYVQAEVRNKTNKEGNTLSTRRDEPADFQFGKDAQLIRRFWPMLKLLSKKLIRIMELLLDYYPDHLGDFDYYPSQEDNFVEFMYYYPELKAYFNTYVRSQPDNHPVDPKLDIGSCGDEEIAALSAKHLDFGALDVEKEPCDMATAYDIAVLLRLLAPMYRVRVVPTMTSRLLSSEPLVKYDTLWLLMRPGTLVYVQRSAFKSESSHRSRYESTRHEYSPYSHHEEDWSPLASDQERSAWIVASWFYEKRDTTVADEYLNVDRFEVDLWSIQYDGTSFQRVTRQAAVHRFEGSRAIKTLSIIPSDLHDRLDGGELRRRLEKRGQRYLSILRDSAAHREYEHPRSGYRGQIIVDPEAYIQYWFEYRELRLDPIADGGGGQRFRNLTNFTPSNSETFPRIREVYILLPRWIEGFGLKTKKWMIFEIDYISEKAPIPLPNQLDNELVLISDADKESLRTVLPKGEKSVGVSSDFVLGKGEGKIFLLYGPPGTGKTLTVECVANDTARPLLSLTAQDVGTRAEFDAETKLRQWFNLAAKWDAILLIDEADLFLEQRREGSLERNSLSTVFLRTMEYYKGVLFLTTNRAGHIDDSFISRITCPITYHPLSRETKGKITKKFVRKFEETGTIEVQPRAESYLIDHCTELNGRQIRNVLQNAVAMAEVQQRSEQLSAHNSGIVGQRTAVVSVRWHHVKAAVERQTEFRLYLDNLKGRDENARAKSKQDYLAAPPRSKEY
jgi:hypothetical protein